MTVDNSGRFEIYEWGSGADPFTRDQMTDSHKVLKERAAGFVVDSGETSASSALLDGYFHYTSKDGSPGVLMYSNGKSWFDINAAGKALPLDGSTSDGISSEFSRSDHTHALNPDIVEGVHIKDAAVGTSELAELAVTTSKIAESAVTNSKLGDDINAAKLVAGFLSPDRIASNSITDAKIVSLDAAKLTGSINAAARIPDDSIANVKLKSGISASKLTTGTLPAARIATNSLSLAKIQKIGGHSVLARLGSSAGTISELTAGTNTVLGRKSSGNLTFSQISKDQIENDAVSYPKMQNSTNGNMVLGKAGGAGQIGEITANTDTVLRRDGSSNIAFGKLDGNHISAGVISASHLANDSVALGVKTTGSYAASVLAGSQITVTKVAANNSYPYDGQKYTVNHADTSRLDGYSGSIANPSCAYHPIGKYNTGTIMEYIRVDGNGHVVQVGSRNLYEWFLNKAHSYGSSSSNVTNGRRIYIQSSTPAHGASGNLWFKT